ncbi:hypothetical protein AU255_12545 [Methyloprofundus sedimenti]|uniref:Uncharacterized protein n=1 Tax=Methyloprofundus sedimenti TaxID=1420851 RepID=A0A1V8MAH9_9GAMM|nr:hypothetical protein [Methyloprofundus sedimenti]OQK18601.1 hypothetical protein AU255_12545 [Methyloprofundus sedimenti]
MQNKNYYITSKLTTLVNKFAVFLMLLLSIGCSQNYEITTWNEWCNHLTDHTLNKLYNLPKIREDFIKEYNEILVEEVVSNHFWDSTIHTNVGVEKLIEERKLGFWVQGNHLHFSNTHLSHASFEGDVERFKKFLSYDVLKDNRYHLNNFQLCIYKAIDSMFDTFTIHTKEETTTITLDFSYKDFFTETARK